MSASAVPGTGDVRASGSSAARSKTMERLARAGLAARGVVYFVVGLLAIKLALGDGGRTTDQQGALKTIAGQPFGKALLVLVALGLLGYAAWRLLRAAVGHGRESSGDDTKERVGGAVSGISYALLFVSAVKILAGSGGGGGGGEDKATGGVLGWPGGPWLVGLAGLVILGMGVEQGRKGLGQSFLKKSHTERMSAQLRRAFTAVGVAGHLARGVVFALIGVFLVKAAIEFDPDEALSLDDALAKLRDTSAGPLLLGVVAAGLLAFAAYSALDARFRRV